MEFQQNPAIVIYQVAKRGIRILCSTIRQLRTIVLTHLWHLIEVLPNICNPTAANLGIGKNPDHLLQYRDITVVKAALEECG